MKVLALNSSPRDSLESKTELMLMHLVKGMREAGAEVEIVNLREKNIKNCIGCYTCWTKTPGKCVHKDDMTQELFPKFIASDLAIYATPLYYYTVNATLKTFMERTLPAIEPFLVRTGEKTRHPLRTKHPAVVILSVAGFPEMSVFDQLSSYMKFIYREGLFAEIYRPAAESLLSPLAEKRREDILDATVEAGKELVKTLKISPATMQRITQPISDPDVLARMANIMWKTCIAEGITPREFQRKRLVLRPDSVEAFMLLMKLGFKPEKAGDFKACLQFNFTGEVEGKCYLTIKNGAIETAEGTASQPNLIINTPFDVWMDIMTNKVDGAKMFIEQKYTVEGDVNILMQMDKLFGEN